MNVSCVGSIEFLWTVLWFEENFFLSHATACKNDDCVGWCMLWFLVSNIAYFVYLLRKTGNGKEVNNRGTHNLRIAIISCFCYSIFHLIRSHTGLILRFFCCTSTVPKNSTIECGILHFFSSTFAVLVLVVLSIYLFCNLVEKNIPSWYRIALHSHGWSHFHWCAIIIYLI